MNEMKTEEPKGELTDRFGAVASSLCALHCAICAMVPSLFGALGLGLLLSPVVENGLALVAILFALGAIVLAWRQHRSNLVLVLLALGIIGLLVSRGLELGAHHDHGEEHHAEAGHEGEGEHEAVAEHHGEEHHGEEHHGEEHHGEEHHGEEHHDEHGEDGIMHALGAGIGVLAGLTLFGGHLLNLRAFRRRREDECCD